MFDFLKKTQPDEVKIHKFCVWFSENNESIISSIENRETDRKAMFDMLNEVEKQLADVYRDGYKGEIEFEYGFNDSIGKWELNLFHMNHKFLISATAKIAEKINGELGKKWQVNIAR